MTYNINIQDERVIELEKNMINYEKKGYKFSFEIVAEQSELEVYCNGEFLVKSDPHFLGFLQENKAVKLDEQVTIGERDDVQYIQVDEQTADEIVNTFINENLKTLVEAKKRTDEKFLNKEITTHEFKVFEDNLHINELKIERELFTYEKERDYYIVFPFAQPLKILKHNATRDYYLKIYFKTVEEVEKIRRDIEKIVIFKTEIVPVDSSDIRKIAADIEKYLSNVHEGDYDEEEALIEIKKMVKKNKTLDIENFMDEQITNYINLVAFGYYS